MRLASALLAISVSASSFASDPADFGGRWYAAPPQTVYADQRGQGIECASGVDIQIEQTPDSLDFPIFNYDCGPAVGGDHAVPYFMLVWQRLSIEGSSLYLGSSKVGEFNGRDLRIELDQTLNGAQIHHKITLRRASDNSLVLEHVTSTGGMDVRLVRASLSRF